MDIALKLAEPELEQGLAQVHGVDDRKVLPRAFYTKRPMHMIAKIVVSSAFVALASWAFLQSAYLYPAAVLVNGLVFAYWVELQHECLHNFAFRSRRTNHVVGTLLGLPMFSSYWEYRVEHLHHHAHLGRADNREFFNYKFEGLDSLSGFIRATFSLHRYKSVLVKMASAVFRTNPAFIKERRASERMYFRVDYLLMTTVILAAVLEPIILGHAYVLLLSIIPALLVGEAAHFLVEMPEHFGLDTQGNTSVYTSTRTIQGSLISYLYTNGNNLHTAHHFHHGVPLCNIRALHDHISDRISPSAFETSYWSFYKRVIRGEIQSERARTCMTA